jgi:hypothetical protein
VRFGDFLKATVLLSAASATLLAALTVIGLSRGQPDEPAVYLCAAWWALAALIGTWLGRRAETSSPIARVLASARAQTLLPEQNAARTILNRLWPLLFSTIVAAVASVFYPQVAGIAAGFAIIWALGWRRQEQAVAAIEERDAVRFYVDKTSPLHPIKLVRTPGFGGDFLREPAGSPR